MIDVTIKNGVLIEDDNLRLSFYRTLAIYLK